MRRSVLVTIVGFPVAAVVAGVSVVGLGARHASASQVRVADAPVPSASMLVLDPATAPASASPAPTASKTAKRSKAASGAATANSASTVRKAIATVTGAPKRVMAVKAKTLPQELASTGGGTQLITAETSGSTNSSRDGTLTWWQKSGSSWVKEGSTAARFGTKGLSDDRLEGDLTTPTGIYTLPSAFGIDANPGTKLLWHQVDSGSWWDENSLDSHYNTWYENCPSTICWTEATQEAHSSEHLADTAPQYDYAIFIGFNAGTTKVRPPARPSGSGIFLHVNGSGHTAGCISVSMTAMESILTWANPGDAPHIVIGNTSSIYRF